MSRIDCIPEAHVQTLAKVLGECGTGSEISRVLQDRRLQDNSGESTKWKRLYWVFMDTQRMYGCANRILDFIRAVPCARPIRRTDGALRRTPQRAERSARPLRPWSSVRTDNSRARRSQPPLTRPNEE